MKRIAIIAGGMGQIGQATARRLADLDFEVNIIVRRNLDQAKQFVSNLSNSGHRAFLASVLDAESLKAVASEIDHCDLLVNAAGITQNHHPKDFESLTDQIFDDIVASNLRGPFTTIREFSPLLKKSSNAVIINITSASSQRASASNIAYGASKAGLELITKSLSKVLAPNIRVMAICPGYLESATSGAIKSQHFNEQISREIPLGRVGSGEDVAKAIEAIYFHFPYSTGSTILLDGGRLA